MERELVTKALRDSFEKLLLNDQCLLINDVNERSLTHQLAVYLKNKFPEWHVDCEYNRKDNSPKRLESFRTSIRNDDTDGQTVFPDIIIHKRRTTDNFVVIEAKKSSNNRRHERENSDCTCDECKLRAYKSDLGYRYAFFVTFPVATEYENYVAENIDHYIKEIV